MKDLLTEFPIYHYFHNGNAFSGAENNMRYILVPGKKPDPEDESGKRKVEFLTVTIWPGPWSLEHTADEKQQSREFEGNQAGLDKAVAWLADVYQAAAETWDVIPSILDCEPDK